jgi:hypothetical protein
MGVNVSGGTTQQSIITAVLRDAQGNLVQNKTVSFSVQDVSGGRIALPLLSLIVLGEQVLSMLLAQYPVPRMVCSLLRRLMECKIGKLTVTQQPLFVILGTGICSPRQRRRSIANRIQSL